MFCFQFFAHNQVVFKIRGTLEGAPSFKGKCRLTVAVADGLAVSSKKHSVCSREKHSRCKPVWDGWIGVELQLRVICCWRAPITAKPIEGLKYSARHRQRFSAFFHVTITGGNGA
jgi:hypothetical protein